MIRVAASLVWSATLALMASTPRVLAATIQTATTECAPNQQDWFNPSTQLPLLCKLADGTVLRSHLNGDHLELSIKRHGLPEVTLSLPASFAQLDRIVAARSNEAVLVGMVSGDVDGVAIVNTANYRVADFFWCYAPKVSPSGQFIAFIKFFPPHFVSGVSDFAMIYDLARSAAGNRPPGVADNEEETVGIRLYPPGRNTEGDNVGVPETESNGVRSDFFWAPDSSRVAFTDQRSVSNAHQQVNANKEAATPRTLALSLVLAKIEVPGEKPLVTVFPIRECRGECKQDLSSVEFAKDGITAQFEEEGTHNKQSVKVKYTKFRTPA